jgi:hypothetical protein
MPEFKLLLEDDEVERLKIMAAKQRVRPQAIARDAFRRGMGAPANNSQKIPCLGDADHSPNLLALSLAETLQKVQAAINQALAELNGMSGGQTTHDQIKQIEAKFDRIDSTGGDPGGGSGGLAPLRITPTKGRRAR